MKINTSDSFPMTFKLTAGRFNRYTVSYSADVCLKATLSYDSADGRKSEDFFLEAGENMTFRSFINGYLDKAEAFGDIEVNAEFITDEGSVSFSDFDTETAPVFEGVRCYIENEKYKVGVELGWGGGLSCIIDKTAENGLGNILNRYDPGRLVQQSYYGTGEAPYVCGEFMGGRWAYNPVQGGDRTGGKSKLIDIDVKPDCLYVKCRPLDWGHERSITPSYMENRYYFVDDCIRVDNRFVDFSGWKHPVRTQEVPAFYTVSYLGNFWHYSGDKPWQNDQLSVERDLFFWPEDWPKHTFPINEGNNETWCAWTDDDDWGIGLYTPGVDKFIGGRHGYDGSKSPDAPSTNYVAPLKVCSLVTLKPFEYSYLMATGKISELRDTFSKKQDFVENFIGYGKKKKETC